MSSMHLDGTALGLPSDPDDLATDAELLATAPYAAMIDCAVMMPSAATAGWAQAYSAASIGNGVITSAATEDAYLEWSVVLAAGTYSLKSWHAEDASYGIATIAIDGGTALGTTIDCYAAAPAVNETEVIAGINIPTTGRHAIRLTAETKNGSSSAYTLAFHALSLVRTGAPS